MKDNLEDNSNRSRLEPTAGNTCQVFKGEIEAIYWSDLSMIQSGRPESGLQMLVLQKIFGLVSFVSYMI